MKKWASGVRVRYSVRYKTVDVSDMEDFPQYLVEKHNTVEMHGVINQIFTFLKMMLCFAGSLAIKLVSMNNQQWMIRPTHIDLKLDELPSLLSIDHQQNRCSGSFNTVENPFGKIFVPNKMEDVNLEVFNMTEGINESKILTKQ